MKNLEKFIFAYAANLFLIALLSMVFKPVIISEKFMVIFYWSAAGVSILSCAFIVFRQYFYGEGIMYPYVYSALFFVSLLIFIINAKFAGYS